MGSEGRALRVGRGSGRVPLAPRPGCGGFDVAGVAGSECQADADGDEQRDEAGSARSWSMRDRRW